MLYAIIAEDIEGSLEQRLAARPAHVERLEALKAAGQIVLAGPHPAIDSEDPGRRGSPAASSWPSSTLRRKRATGPQPIHMSAPGYTRR